MSEEIQASAPKSLSKEVTFRFKKDDLGNKRADIKLSLLVPSWDGIAEILQGAETTHIKEYELLQEAMLDVIASSARGIVNGDEKITGTDNFPVDQVSWKAIANQSKEDRRSNSIPEEQWKAFAADYVAVMPSVSSKSLEQVTNATLVYLKKFTVVKTDKVVLSKLQTQLGLYAENSKNAEQFSDILELLSKRLETYLAADDIKALTENL